MIIVFTLGNISIVSNKIIKGKLSNIFISEVCIKLVGLRINPHPRSSSPLQEGWWSLDYGILSLHLLEDKSMREQIVSPNYCSTLFGKASTYSNFSLKPFSCLYHRGNSNW